MKIIQESGYNPVKYKTYKDVVGKVLIDTAGKHFYAVETVSRILLVNLQTDTQIVQYLPEDLLDDWVKEIVDACVVVKKGK